jgi:hypothetical protein
LCVSVGIKKLSKLAAEPVNKLHQDSLILSP